jgi:hypothetical protein
MLEDLGAQQEIRVSWLAVWNRDLPGKPDSKQKDEPEDQDNDGKEHDDDAAGVLYAWSTDLRDAAQAIADPVMSRRIGLAQGLVDFSR